MIRHIVFDMGQVLLQFSAGLFAERLHLSEEDAELILMRIGTDEEGEYMDIVDDDEELLTVGKVFEERLSSMYDIDDSELE